MSKRGDSESWAVGCTLAPFVESEGTGRRAICVENNGFSLKLSRGDTHKATECVDLELRTQV